MWKLLREKVGVPSPCCFFGFWYLIFFESLSGATSGGDQQTTGPNIQVEATLYLLHLSVSRSHTWVLRKPELCKSIFASHNRVFFLLFWVFILQMVLMFKILKWQVVQANRRLVPCPGRSHFIPAGPYIRKISHVSPELHKSIYALHTHVLFYCCYFACIIKGCRQKNPDILRTGWL